MDFTTIYKALQKKAADFLPAVPKSPLGTGSQAVGVPASNANSAVPKLPPGKTPEQAMNTASELQGGVSAGPEPTGTPVEQLTSALNKITDVAKATLKGQTPPPAAAAASSPAPTGAGTPLPKMATVIQSALKKSAAAPAIDVSKNSIPASHYQNRPMNEEAIRTYLGLKPGSDKAFWRSYYAGKNATDQASLNYYNMLANAANTPGDHQRFYANGGEPPYEDIRHFGEKQFDNKLYPFIRKSWLKGED